MTDLNHKSTEPSNRTASPDGQEPVQQLRERGVHGDNESHPEPQADESPSGTFRALSTQPGLPLWIAEKFHWVQGAGGRSYLSPNADFMAAVIGDAPKAVKYGYELVLGKDGNAKSVERTAITDLSTSLGMALETLTAVDASEREINAFKRWLIERATSNFVYCAITQFEIDNWAARAAAQGKNAADNDNFSDKVSRRDEFARNGAIFHAVAKQVLPTVAINDETFAKQAKTLIYQQARIRTQELQNPAEIAEGDKQQRAMAVASNRAF